MTDQERLALRAAIKRAFPDSAYDRIALMYTVTRFLETPADDEGGEQ